MPHPHLSGSAAEIQFRTYLIPQPQSARRQGVIQTPQVDKQREIQHRVKTAQRQRTGDCSVCRTIDDENANDQSEHSEIVNNDQRHRQQPAKVQHARAQRTPAII